MLSRNELLQLGGGVALAATVALGAPTLLAHYGIALSELTPNQRVAQGFSHWTVKGDKDQARIVTVPVAVTQPALSPEVQAIIENVAPFGGDCISFLPPDYKACPVKPVVAEGQ
jgi:hypothetical protein